MADTGEPIEIPDRAFFKAAEVCELAKVQPYVLRSWEVEFKDLGVPKSGSTVRVYRRSDVERVFRIKHLLLIEGLTLAGVRRRLEEEEEPPLEELVAQSVTATAVTPAVKERIEDIRRGLRALLEMLESGDAGRGDGTAGKEPADFMLAPAAADGRGKSSKPGEATATIRSAPSPRRKRST